MKNVILTMVLVIGMSTVVQATMTFTEYGSGATRSTSLAEDAPYYTTWGKGPWSWYNDGNPSMLFDEYVTGTHLTIITGEAQVTDDIIAIAPNTSIFTFESRDPVSDEINGTMKLTGTGALAFDFNAETVVSVEESGMILGLQGEALQLDIDLSGELFIEDATGIFADIEQVGPWKSYYSGWLAGTRIAGMDLQDNMNLIVSGQHPGIGGLVEFAITGQYVPEPATMGLLALGGLALLRRRKG